MALKDMALGLVITAKDKSAQAVGSAKRGLSSLKNTFSEVRKASGAAGKFSAFRKGLKNLLPSMESVKKTAVSMGKGIAGIAAGVTASAATLTVFSKRQAAIADDLTNTSNAIGVNREALQVWQIGAERVGLSGEKMTDILRNVTKRMGEFASTGKGPAKDAFDALNLGAADFQGLQPEEQMLRLAQSLEDLPKGEQVAILEKLARDSSQIQPLLENNAAGLKAIEEAARRDGALYSEEELDNLVKANDVYNDVSLKIQGLTRRIGAKLAPAVADVTDKLLTMFNQSDLGDRLVDMFTALSEKVLEFGRHMTSNADEIQGKLSTLTNTFQFLGQSAIAVFRGIQTVAAGFVLGIATGFSNLLRVTERVTAGLNKLGLVSDSAYNGIRAKAEAAKATTLDLERQVTEYGKQTAEAAGKAMTAFDDVAESTEKATQANKENVGTLKTVEQTVNELAEAERKREEAQRNATNAARENLKKYGIDLEQVMTGVSTEGRAAVESVMELTRTIEAAGLESKDAAEAFEIGFKNAIAQVNSEEGVKALQRELEKVGDSGVIGANAVREAMELTRVKLKEVSESAQSVREVMEQAIDTTGTIEGLEFLEVSLQAAAMSGKDVTSQLERVRQKIEEVKQAQSGEGGEGIDKPMSDLADETQRAGDEAESAGNRGGQAMDFFGAAITKARERVYALSTAARDAFERKTGLGNLSKDAEAFSDKLREVRGDLSDVRKAMGEARRASWTLTGSGLTRWALETKQASLEVAESFYAQAASLENLTNKVNSGTYSMDQLNRISERAENRFDLLDEQQLNGLQSAIDSARRKMESLSDSADSTLSSLRQRLADIRGDTEEAQQIQYEQERKRLEEQLAAAEATGATEAASDYREALDVLREINREEQRQASEDRQRREQEAADRAREQQRANNERQQTGRLDDIRDAMDTNRPATETVKTVKIEIGGREVEVLAGQEDTLIEALENARMRSS